MNDYKPDVSVWGKLTGTIPLTGAQPAVIKQTYLLFGVSERGPSLIILLLACLRTI